MHVEATLPQWGEAVGSGERGGYATPFRSLFDRSGICMASLGTDLRIQEANAPFRSEFGHAGTCLVGKQVFDFLRVRTQADLRHRLTGLAAGWSERLTERVEVMRGGERADPAHLTAVSTRAECPDSSGVVVMLQWTSGEVRQRRGPRIQLTDLDARILQGVAIGLSTVNLASKLYLSRQGVEYHVGTMLKKFKASNRPALVSRAYSVGVLDATCWPPTVAPEFIK